MLVTSNNYESAPNISLENPFPNGFQKPIGDSQGELTNIGTISSFVDPNFGRSYTDAASFSIQQQIQKYLFEAGMTLDETHGLSMGWEINDPSPAIYHAENDPQFTSTGAPVSSLPGNTYVNNPFYQVPGISTSASPYTQQYVTASTLLRPNPLLGNLVDNKATGIVRYYALNTKVERRFQNGFSFLQAFTWSKDLTANNFIGPQSLVPVIQHTLSGNDNKFHYVLTPVYELPFGHGKQFANQVNRATDELIGGWEFTGEYQFISGTPLSLKTNSNFFQGGDPSLGSSKSGTQWFNTSKFKPYPSSSTTVAQLAAYPSWTGVAGLPGASWTPAGGSINNGVFNDFTSYYVTRGQTVWGDVRNPYTTVFSLGARKSFAITESVHFQLGLDAFNALNHPIFGNIDTTPSDSGFGCFSGSCSPSKWVQTNSPRTVQLRGRFAF